MLLEFLNAYRGDLQYIASILLALAMWRWGAGPERGMAIMFTGVMVAPSALFRLFADRSMLFGDFAVLYIAVDVLALAGFMAIALNANRNYPLWVAGFQLVAVGSHIVQGVVDAASPIAYVILAVGPSYCQLVILLAGLVRHRRRLKRYGPYRDWRDGHSLPQLAAALSAKG